MNYNEALEVLKGITEKAGLYANIHAKRKRGGRMRSEGDPKSPTDADFRDAARTAKSFSKSIEYSGERFSGYNKPKRTPSHPKKSHVVLARSGGKTKLIRFGQQGAKTAGKPKSGESARMKAKRKSFKARHRKNIARGRLSGAYWANKVKW